MFSHPNVQCVTRTDASLTVQNIWEEMFDITFYDIPGFGIAAHAEKI